MQDRQDGGDKTDWFPTPPWATRALLTHVIGEARGTCLDPCVGEGYMAEVLKERFKTVSGMDIVDYGYPGAVIRDFTTMDHENPAAWNWIITNPPFKLAEKFIEVAFRHATDGVAMLVRTSFLEGIGRYRALYSVRPPSVVAQFSERVPMVKGRYDPKASTATSYCWLVWRRRSIAELYARSTVMMWIPPCREALEKLPGDEIIPSLRIDTKGQMP